MNPLNKTESPYPRQPSRISLDDFNQKLKAKYYLTAAIWIMVSLCVIAFLAVDWLRDNLVSQSIPFAAVLVTTNFITGLLGALICGWAMKQYGKSFGLSAIATGILGGFIAFLEIAFNLKGFLFPAFISIPLHSYHLILWALYFGLQLNLNRQLKNLYGMKHLWFIRSSPEISAIRTQLSAEEAALPTAQLMVGVNLNTPSG